MAIAKTDSLSCYRCGGRIKLGSVFRWANRPRTQTPFHMDCKLPDGAAAQDEAVEAPSEPAMPPPLPTRSPTPQPASGTGLDAVLSALIRAEIAAAQPNGPAVDADTLAALVRDAVEKYGTREVVISVDRGDGEPPVKLDSEHYLYPRLLKLLRAGFSVYLWGPAGSGKTTAALRAARLLYPERTSEIDTLDAGTFKSAVLGFKDASGAFQGTAFTRCYSQGGAYIADEVDNAPAGVQTLFNSALANGHAPTAAGMVARADDFVFVGTGNTPGRPSPAFPDRKLMSAAFKDRLYFMFWPLDPNIERRACGRSLKALPTRAERTCTASEWGKWVEDVRAWAEKNAPTLMVTPRATLDGLKALACGETPAEVAHGLVFRGADDTYTSKALAAHPLP